MLQQCKQFLARTPVPCEHAVLSFLILTFFILVFSTNGTVATHQQFTYLAQSFLDGTTHFSDAFFSAEHENLIDTVFMNGAYYWPLSPLPAIVLMPFVFIANRLHLFFLQGYLQFFLTLGIFALCCSIAKRRQYTPRDALWLAFAFVAASPYQQVAFVTQSWYFVHAITVFAALLALNEWCGRRRWWHIGLASAAVFASRVTAGVGILFFIGSLLHTLRNGLRARTLAKLAVLIAPTIIAGALLFWYNAARFGNPMENGYRLANNAYLNEAQRFELLHYGLFQLRNIPTNFYYYFIKTVDPVTLPVETAHGRTHILTPPYITPGYPGVGFFVTAPIFLYLFSRRTRYAIRTNTTARLATITVVSILLLLLSYYWPGWRQIGPRYLLDLLPFAYLILLESFPAYRVPRSAKLLIVCSAIFNLYLTVQFFSA